MKLPRRMMRSRPMKFLAPFSLLVFVLLGGLAMSACGGEEEEPAVTYCDVVPVLDASCRRCHGDPQENGAPLSLVSFDAIHAEYPKNSGRPAWRLMRSMVAGDAMPPVGLEVTDGKGPVEPLAEEERALLLEWLDEGAPRGSSCSAK